MPWTISVKHASSAPSVEDGVRVLVDRRWPPGLRREEVNADLWLKDIAPSDELLRRRGTDPERWEEFAQRYRAELMASEDLRVLGELHARGPITLLHSIRDSSRNNAVVLRQLLEDTPLTKEES